MEIKSANKVSGSLLYSGENYFFRIYNEDGTFTDYDLLHCDLSITIDDEDAFFYVDGDKKILDHSPETLGLNYKSGPKVHNDKDSY